MFRVFNMGVGFCVVVSPEGESRVKEIAEEHRFGAWTLGRCVPDEQKRVWLNTRGLVGQGGKFLPADLS